jgi:hypothetical protein
MVPDAVSLSPAVLDRYRHFSLYNSPYPAHDAGHGIDLYPETNVAVSPVSGEVLDTRTVQCPDRPYAVDHDHLILIDTDETVARILHVDPAVEAGEQVAVGDALGRMVRSGFFGQWVDNHVHLEFRDPDANLYRASGSLPLVADVDVTPVPWDGTGRVVDTGETFAVLDAPDHPNPGSFAALASGEGIPLDGGLCHYTGGGRFDVTRVGGDADAERSAGEGADTKSSPREITLLDTVVGTASGRTISWGDVRVLANGERVTGLSLFASRSSGFGVKLVSRSDAGEPSFSVGESVTVEIERGESVTLG